MNKIDKIKMLSPDAESGSLSMLDSKNIALMNAVFKGIENVNKIYFIGIGGIGMSAVARFFYAKAVKVCGYDKTATVLTKELEAMGIDVHYEDNVALAPKDVDLVVYTPAIPKDHTELQFYQQNNYRVVKRSDVLQIITQNSFNICIAGTHGKTTITTMVAHLLRDSGFGCNAFLGGIAANYNSNFWENEKNVCVVEADEYDRSFLKLSPDVAIVTAMDADHLDIYGTAEAVDQAFIDFGNRVKPGGLLIKKFGLPKGKQLKADNVITYSLQNDTANVYATNIKLDNGGYVFDVVVNNKIINNLQLRMGGMHNIENAVAAIAVADLLMIDAEKIKVAIGNFKGVKRRFEYILAPSDEQKDKWKTVIFIDDYAHHPEELRALITGAKTLFKGKKCTIIFQPHLFSRTKDHADGFAEVLDMADEVILLPIYPARELPLPGVTSDIILQKMKNANKKVLQKEELINWVEKIYCKQFDKEFGGLFITAGAGDIDTLLESIKNTLKSL